MYNKRFGPEVLSEIKNLYVHSHSNGWILSMTSEESVTVSSFKPRIENDQDTVTFSLSETFARHPWWFTARSSSRFIFLPKTSRHTAIEKNSAVPVGRISTITGSVSGSLLSKTLDLKFFSLLLSYFLLFLTHFLNISSLFVPFRAPVSCFSLYQCNPSGPVFNRLTAYSAIITNSMVPWISDYSFYRQTDYPESFSSTFQSFSAI